MLHDVLVPLAHDLDGRRCARERCPCQRVAAERAEFTAEFKAEAVAMVEASGGQIAKVARERSCTFALGNGVGRPRAGRRLCRWRRSGRRSASRVPSWVSDFPSDRRPTRNRRGTPLPGTSRQSRRGDLYHNPTPVVISRQARCRVELLWVRRTRPLSSRSPTVSLISTPPSWRGDATDQHPPPTSGHHLSRPVPRAGGGNRGRARGSRSRAGPSPPHQRHPATLGRRRLHAGISDMEGLGVGAVG